MATSRKCRATPARLLALAGLLGLPVVAASAESQEQVVVRHTVTANVAPIASVRSVSTPVATTQSDSVLTTTVVTAANAPHDLQVWFDHPSAPIAVRIAGGEWKSIEPDTWTSLATRPHGKHTDVIELRSASGTAPTPAWRAVSR